MKIGQLYNAAVPLEDPFGITHMKYVTVPVKITYNISL